MYIYIYIYIYIYTVEPQGYEPQSYELTNTKWKKVGKVTKSIPGFIRLRIPSTRIAAAAML